MNFYVTVDGFLRNYPFLGHLLYPACSSVTQGGTHWHTFFETYHSPEPGQQCGKEGTSAAKSRGRLSLPNSEIFLTICTRDTLEYTLQERLRVGLALVRLSVDYILGTELASLLSQRAVAVLSGDTGYTTPNALPE